tara:strand:+ start:365 stop:1312 length:948 start_codon:yes stop_codon:yes gene_type:complete
MFKNKEELLKILKFQYKYIFPTPQIYWPKIYKRFGNKVWVKHENHTIIGSFKIRSSLNLINNESKKTSNFCCASNGNYGQGIAFSCSALNKKSVIFCPIKTSKNKINSIKSLGGSVHLEGNDFTETYEIAKNYASKNNSKLLQSYNDSLAKGCSTYAYELFEKINKLDKVYVPIGLGSGICGTIYARNLLNLKTEIIGVVPKGANSYFLSFKNKNLTPINKVSTFAEGTAVRLPNKEALEIIFKNVADIIQIDEDNIKSAIKNIYDDTGNISEGSGALSYAAAYKDRNKNKNKNIGIILTGGNIDRKLYSKILSK